MGENTEKKPENHLMILLSTAFLGLAIRLFLLLLLPQGAFYQSDHLTQWSWWKNSLEKGLFNSYGYNRPERCTTFSSIITVQKDFYSPDGAPHYRGEKLRLPERSFKARPINYPPLSAYLVHLQGLLHRAIDPRLEPLTPVSWIVLELPVFLTDWILALGCMFILRRLRGPRWGLTAYLLVWFCPGILLTGVLWGQYDSWFLAAGVWSLYFCLEKRWSTGGFLYGCALLIKPQALFMVPAMAYFLLTRGSLKPFIRFISSCLGTAMILALPFMCHSGLAWLQNCYVSNLSGALLPYTTLEAFNIWMLDALMGSRNTDIHATLLGISKESWGLIFILAGIALSGMACRRRYGRQEHMLPMGIALTYAVVFLFSTQVHERFIIYILPFLAISIGMESCFEDTFIGYSILSVFEITSHMALPHSTHLQGASFAGLSLLALFSMISFYVFFDWLIGVWCRKSSCPAQSLPPSL